jgi:hypothetical protein
MSLLSHPLVPGQPITLWQHGETVATRYDVPDQPMAGEMDPFFFLTKEKNIIPHEYPCRTQFAQERRGKRPQIVPDGTQTKVWLPFGSPRLDLSGFWFRATHIATAASCTVDLERPGRARLALRTCGGAILTINGTEAGWMAPYRRNAETREEFTVELNAGENRIEVWFDDLAERDARYYLQVDWLEGPPGVAGIAVPNLVAARSVETALATLHFDAPAYAGGVVALTLPQPLDRDASVSVKIEGDFMSHQAQTAALVLPAGARRLELAQVSDLPGDFRHFRVTLSAGGFEAGRTFGVEVCDMASQAAVPETLARRVDEALNWVAERAEPDTVAALARLALGLGDERTERMIETTLPTIEDCWDCADFALVPLLWSRIRWGDLMSGALRARVDRAILGYRYWMDEPGNDVQWYFSENHALLFHTAAYLAGTLLPEAVFTRSGRKGIDQATVGLARVRAWLDHFAEWEMAEFNSAPYFPIDLKGLTALYALAPDADVRAKAQMAIGRLLLHVARSAHHGVLTAAQGRSYEHTLRAGRTLELSAITRLCFGTGNLGARFHALPGLALAIRDHGLTIDPALAAVADLTGGEQEWAFAQGQGRFAALYHAKTADWAMGSAGAYRWFDWGYQETLIHARIGRNPDAQVWVNHPGEVIHSGYGRPSYWGGSASVPRCQQYRGLAMLFFDGQPEQPDFTHAWFPAPVFDEVQLARNTAAARSGNGAMLIRTSGPLEMVQDGPTTGCELRLSGRRGWWLLRLGQAGALDTFKAQFAGLTLIGDDPRAILSVEDPEYGPVTFHPDGTIEAEGRKLSPKDWTVEGHVTLPLAEEAGRI